MASAVVATLTGLWQAAVLAFLLWAVAVIVTDGIDQQ